MNDGMQASENKNCIAKEAYTKPCDQQKRNNHISGFFSRISFESDEQRVIVDEIECAENGVILIKKQYSRMQHIDENWNWF